MTALKVHNFATPWATGTLTLRLICFYLLLASHERGSTFTVCCCTLLKCLYFHAMYVFRIFFAECIHKSVYLLTLVTLITIFRRYHFDKIFPARIFLFNGRMITGYYTSLIAESIEISGTTWLRFHFFIIKASLTPTFENVCEKRGSVLQNKLRSFQQIFVSLSISYEFWYHWCLFWVCNDYHSQIFHP